ncbi:MAG: hypothetical protein M0R77_10640 [Gammaproteobacteria bacterium]|nr:hypothetical protein [Gammaproteobacteria bacterium]
MSLSINIPDEHYVTFTFRSDDIYPLGFLVPEGKDQASIKKKATADQWASRSKVQVPAKTFKNKPMVGFEIRKSVQHYRSRGANKEVWRILDPRGFELEITNDNMEFIIDHCILDKGEIISSCIWGREGSRNMLLPVDCDEYRAAIANTERLSKKASMRDVKLGDHVTFKKGTRGRFLGKYYKYVLEIGNQFDLSSTIEVSSSKYYVFVDDKQELTISSSVQVSEINKSEPISEADAEVLVNQLIQVKNSSYRYSDAPVMMSTEKIEFNKFTPDYSPISNLDEVMPRGYYHAILTAKNNGLTYVVDAKSSSYSYNKDTINATEIKKTDLDENIITYVQIPQSGYYGGNRMTPKRLSIDSKTLSSMYDIEVLSFSYKTSLGTEVEIKI